MTIAIADSASAPEPSAGDLLRGLAESLDGAIAALARNDLGAYQQHLQEQASLCVRLARLPAETANEPKLGELFRRVRSRNRVHACALERSARGTRSLLNAIAPGISYGSVVGCWGGSFQRET